MRQLLIRPAECAYVGAKKSEHRSGINRSALLAATIVVAAQLGAATFTLAGQAPGTLSAHATPANSPPDGELPTPVAFETCQTLNATPLAAVVQAEVLPIVVPSLPTVESTSNWRDWATVVQSEVLPLVVPTLPAPASISNWGRWMIPPAEVSLLFLITLFLIVRSRRAQPRVRRALRTVAVAAAAVGTVAYGALVFCAYDLANGHHDRAFMTTQAVGSGVLFTNVGSTWLVGRGTVSPWLSTIGNRGEEIGEAAGLYSSRQALGDGNLSAAIAYQSFPTVARTTTGQLMRRVVYLTLAADLVESGDLNRAADAAIRATAERAPRICPEACDDDAVGMLNSINTRRVLAALEDGDPSHAAALLEQIGETSPGRGLLAALVARHEAIAPLRQLETIGANVDQARRLRQTVTAFAASIEALRSGLGRVDEGSIAAGYVHCDLAEALETTAKLQLEQANPAAAVTLLTEAAQHVGNSPATEALLPHALQLRGRDELEAGNADAAMVTFTQSLQHRLADRPSVISDYVRAGATKTTTLLRARRFDDALTLARQVDDFAHTGSSGDALAVVRLARSNVQQCAGNWRAAQAEVGLARRRGRMVPQINARAQQIAFTEATLGRFTRMSAGFDLPVVRGGRSLDDGRSVRLCNEGGREVGSIDRRQPATAIFTDVANPSAIHLMIRDADRDGEFDERMQVDGERSWVLLDIDRDRRADLEFHYRGNVLVAQKALSGRIAFRINAAAIAFNADWWWAGASDAYYLVGKNGVLLGRSDVFVNSQQPSWRMATVIDYRRGDRVDVALWDEDDYPWGKDDFIDSLSFGELPRSGVHKMNLGRAAIQTLITPATEPEGYKFFGPSSVNVFRETPGAISGTLAEIVRKSADIERTRPWTSMAARIGILEVAARVLFPQAGFLAQTALAVGIDLTILEQIYRSDTDE